MAEVPLLSKLNNIPCVLGIFLVCGKSVSSWCVHRFSVTDSSAERPLEIMVASSAWLIVRVPALLHCSSLSPDISTKPVSQNSFRTLALFFFFTVLL